MNEAIGAANAFVEEIRPFIELLYLASGCAIAVFSWRALKQVDLLKRDILLRSERAAKERAIEACQRYLQTYIPLADEDYRDRNEKNIPVYDGPFDSFDFRTWPEIRSDAALKRFKRYEKWLPAMNELESIAATFASGVGDEALGFEIIGVTFCGTVASHFDVLAVAHTSPDGPGGHYNSIVKMYLCWSPRIEKKRLSAVRRSIDAKIGEIRDNAIQPLGGSLP
jgi:hypothetical protein